MAQRIITVMTDDLDGGTADVTVKFALDGLQYEIDLSDANAAQLRDMLAPYIAAGNMVLNLSGRPAKVGVSYQGGTRTRGGKAAAKATAKADRAKKRAWHAANWKAAELPKPNDSGMGRIPVAVTHAYNQHNGEPVKPAPVVDEQPAPVVVPAPRGRRQATPTPVKTAKATPAPTPARGRRAAAPPATFSAAPTPTPAGKVTAAKTTRATSRTGTKAATKKATAKKG